MPLDNPIDGDFGGYAREKTTAEFIRDYLDENEPAYVSEIHQAYCEWCDERGYGGCSYQSIRNVMYLLRDSGLIEESHTEPAQSPALEDRRYYRLSAPVHEGHPMWRDPWGETYGRE